MKIIEKCYTVRNIYFLSDSQTAIKTLDSFEINFKLIWDCYQFLVKLGKHNKIQLVWVPGHVGIDWNEIADHLARPGPEPALGIFAKAVRVVIRGWMNRKHKE